MSSKRHLLSRSVGTLGHTQDSIDKLGSVRVKQSPESLSANSLTEGKYGEFGFPQSFSVT